MKQHHKCMGCTAWVALHGAALHGVALHGVALLGAAMHGVALHGAARMYGTALHGLHNCMFYFGGGGGGAIPLRRAYLIKPQLVIMVINSDCRITIKS